MKYNIAVSIASRGNVRLNTLVKLAHDELELLSGSKRFKLAYSILCNPINRHDDNNCIGTAVMEELFDRKLAEDFSADELILLIQFVIHCRYEEKFLEFLKEQETYMNEDEYNSICEKYSLLESDYAYEFGVKPVFPSEYWEYYAFFE